jgi:hypothetical protein
MDSSHTVTPSKHEKEDDESSIDLTMFDIEDDKSSVDLKCLTQRMISPLTRMIVATTLKR